MLDGELVIPVDGELSFDALQMRLHPAESRIKRLARETPAIFVAFDCLLRKPRQPLLETAVRGAASELEAFFDRAGAHHGLSLTPFTRDLRKAKTWLNGRQLSLDGVVAKRLDLPYRPASAPCSKSSACARPIASSAAFATQQRSAVVGSLLLGLYDEEGLLHHVGFTSAISTEDKPALTERLEKLVALRASPATRRAGPAAGARSDRPNGSRCGPSWWSRSATIT